MSLRSLHTAVYDALCSFPHSAQFSSLAHAQVRNLLADHLTGALYHDGWVQRDEQPEEKTTPAVGAAVTPEFFQPGHTYAREHHGRRIEFHVLHIATAPDCDYPTAFGWRSDPEIDVVLPANTDDMGGWTDTTDSPNTRAGA